MQTEKKIYRKKLLADISTAVYSDSFADQYNSAVDRVLQNPELQKEFFEILDEQKAVMTIDGEMSEQDAERFVCQPDNLRRAAMFCDKQETRKKRETL